MDSESARLTGAHPDLGAASLSLVEDRLRWTSNPRAGESAPVPPGAGSGVAAAIADLVLGRPPESGDDAARERGIPVDQTHTSVIVDERWVVKIVGAWGAAERSASMLSALQRAGSAVAPVFGGSLLWEHSERGTGTIAVISEYIPDSEDGWTWAVDDVCAFLSAAGGGSELTWPGELGALTAQMHAALLAVEARPGGPSDPRSGDRARAEALLARVHARTEPGGAFEHRLLNRREALSAALATIPLASATPLILPHGDFHVGQILRVGGGAGGGAGAGAGAGADADADAGIGAGAGRMLVLDFDGDPQWGAAQQFRLDGAARDVAHMLASIDLVAAVAQRRLGGPDERAWEWAVEAQREFLGAYDQHSAPGMLDHDALPGLIAEQLLLEVAYADRYLPRWRYAPDGVISRRYASSRHYPEHPWNPPASSTT